MSGEAFVRVGFLNFSRGFSSALILSLSLSDQMEAKASESQGGAVLTVEEITKGSYIFPNGDKYGEECDEPKYI